MSMRWPRLQLREILDERREVPDQNEVALGRIRIVAKIGFAEGNLELRTGVTTKTELILVRPGDLLVSGINAAKGAIAIYKKQEPHPIAATIHYGAYSVRKNIADTAYLWWYLRSRSFRELLHDALPGGIKTELKAKRLLPLKIPLPPLSEQRRIVTRIEELAAKISDVRALRLTADADAAAIVSSAFVKMFVDGQSKGWKRARLGDVLVEACYGTSEKTHDDRSGVAVLRMGNIQDGRLSVTSLKYLHLSERDKRKLILRAGDILVNRTNSAELLGKCAVFDIPGEFAFASYIIRLRINQSQADPALIAAYINSPLGRAYIFSVKRQMTGQANVNSKTLRAMPILLPALDEQHNIVALLDSIRRRADALRRIQATVTVELHALLPSIIDRAFKGEL